MFDAVTSAVTHLLTPLFQDWYLHYIVGALFLVRLAWWVAFKITGTVSQ